MINEINKLINTVQSLQDRRKDMFAEVEKMNDSLLDYHHHIELGNLDAVQTMKLIRSMKTMLMERRVIKDELALLSSLQDIPKHATLRDKLKNVVTNLDAREYRTRHVSLEDVIK